MRKHAQTCANRMDLTLLNYSLYNDFMRKMDFCIVTLQNQEIFKRSLKGEGKLQDQCKKSNCICLLYEYRSLN
jgi:hypothetical protein